MSSDEMKVVCIICPQGCEIKVGGSKKNPTVSGNKCPKGFDYAVKEYSNPERMITSSVKVEGGVIPLVSVKTEKPVPKEKIFDVMGEIRQIKVKAPVNVGDVLSKDLAKTGVKLVATKKIEEKTD